MITSIDKIFWLRVFMGILTGLVLGILTSFTSFSSSNGILFALFMYIVSYYTARITLSANINSKDARKLVTTGLVNFIMLFLFTWILINTLFNAGSA